MKNKNPTNQKPENKPVDLSEKIARLEILKCRQYKPPRKTLSGLLVEKAPVLLWMTGPDAQFIFFNEGWLSFTGRPLREQAGSRWTRDIHPADQEEFLNVYKTAFSRRREFKARYRFRRYDGVYRWFLNSGTPNLSEKGIFCGFVGACMDITDLIPDDMRVEI